MKKMFFYLLLSFGLFVSAVGHASVHWINPTGDHTLADNTIYKSAITNVKGAFTNDWYFGITHAEGFGSGVNEISFAMGKTVYDIKDDSLLLTLEKKTGSSWTNVLQDKDLSRNGVSFKSLAAGDYRLEVSGTGIGGTQGLGKYALSTHTVVAAVPELEEWGMLLIGIALLALQLHRKNASQDAMIIAA